jgi:hypothetical protein
LLSVELFDWFSNAIDVGLVKPNIAGCDGTKGIFVFVLHLAYCGKLLYITCSNIKTITELHACVIRLDQYVTTFFIIKSVCLGVE